MCGRFTFRLRALNIQLWRLGRGEVVMGEDDFLDHKTPIEPSRVSCRRFDAPIDVKW